jgi:hypothetical protein
VANNRLALVCKHCEAQGLPDSRHPLLKYYPSTGWYINREPEHLVTFGSDVQTWLDRHEHRELRSMWGHFLWIEYETPPDYVVENVDAADLK